MSRASNDGDTLSVRLSGPERVRFAALAESTGRGSDDLIAEALNRYLDDEEQQITRIQEGIADADAGRVHSEADVEEEMDQIVANARARPSANLRPRRAEADPHTATSGIAQDDSDAAERLAQLGAPLLQAMQGGDNAAMGPIQQQIQAVHSRLHPTAEEDMVRLYEDGNAGALLLLHPGGLAYDVTAWAATDEGEFEYDAVAVLNGETFDQTVRTYPSDQVDLSDDTWRLIAVYDGAVGSVTEQRDESGMILAGAAGRCYIAPKPMGDQTGYYQ